MTLIIGFKCSDGIVLGADGAATMGALGLRTIQQQDKKLKVIADKAVLGVSGPVSLGQKFASILDQYYSKDEFNNLRSHEATQKLQQLFWPPVQQEMMIAAQAKQLIGQMAIESALSSTLVAMVITGELKLLEGTQQCSFEEVAAGLTFSAIGSGIGNSHAFLAFLRRVFFVDEVPTISDGVFYTVWTLAHTISIDPGGVGGDIQIVVLRLDGGTLSIEELGQEELQEHYAAIEEAEKRLSSFRRELAQGVEGEQLPPPEPPVPRSQQ